MDDHDALAASWNQTSSADWSRHLNAAQFAAYQQHFAYGEWLRRVGTTVHRVLIKQNSAPIAMAQMQLRRFFGLFSVATILMGPIWLRQSLSTQTKADALKLIARSAPLPPRCVLLIMPAESDPASFQHLKSPRLVSSYHTALLDLSQGADAVRRGLHGKWRNRLNAAERSDLKVRVLPHTPDAWMWLLEKEKAQRKRARYKGMPVQMIPSFQQEAGKKSVMVLAAELDDLPVAGCLFLRHGRSATYHIGWSSPDGKALNAHNLLLWNAIDRLCESGTQTLDMGGLVGDASRGLTRFKLGTGARAISQAGTYLLRPQWQ